MENTSGFGVYSNFEITNGDFFSYKSMIIWINEIETKIIIPNEIIDPTNV